MPLSRTAIERATQQERLLYGALIEGIRKAKSLTQTELEERSGVTSRTIRNIETGAVAGQADKLIRLFIALEVDLDGAERAEVDQYLSMLAPLIRSIAPDHRLAAVTSILPTLTDAVREHPNLTDTYEHQELPVLDEHRARKLRTESTALAARRGESDADRDHGED